MADYDSKKIEEDSHDATQDAPPTQNAPISVLEDGSLDPVYEAKAKVLNKAIQDIGMGRYQWQVGVPCALPTIFLHPNLPNHPTT